MRNGGEFFAGDGREGVEQIQVVDVADAQLAVDHLKTQRQRFRFRHRLAPLSRRPGRLRPRLVADGWP